MNKHVLGFMEFIQEQGVVGIAVAFVLGAAVTKLVAAFVTDIINPILGIFLGKAQGLGSAVIKVGSAEILIGSFILAMIDFLVVALVVYFMVKVLKADRLDKKKE